MTGFPEATGPCPCRDEAGEPREMPGPHPVLYRNAAGSVMRIQCRHCDQIWRRCDPTAGRQL